MAKVVTNIICRFVRCVGCGFFGSRLFEFVSAAVITLVVTVSIFMSESCNSLFVCCTAAVVTGCNFLTCLAALGFFSYFILCEGVFKGGNNFLFNLIVTS